MWEVIHTTLLTLDWKEIFYILIGTCLGVVTSCAILFLERFMDKKGKLNIFYKRSLVRGSSGYGWGFDNTGDGRVFFIVPVVFELQNTSNTTRVIRDVSLLLYNEKKFVAKMKQAEKMHTKTRTGSTVTGEQDYYFGTEKGSYSFVLEPRSIQRQECEYMLVIPSSTINEKLFNNVVIRYHDEKNKAHYYKMMNVPDCWQRKHYDVDEEWVLLERKQKINIKTK